MMRLWLLFITALMLMAACEGETSIQPTPSLDPLAAKGKQIFNQNCATCHALSPDTIIVGPSLAGIASRAGSRLPDTDARQYLELSILKPDAYIVQGFSDTMPKDLGKKLTGEELDALAAFLLTLK
ncbi:MAG: c-type cytochrome [Anaerolineae bacterium]